MSESAILILKQVQKILGRFYILNTFRTKIGCTGRIQCRKGTSNVTRSLELIYWNATYIWPHDRCNIGTHSSNSVSNSTFFVWNRKGNRNKITNQGVVKIFGVKIFRVTKDLITLVF